MDSIPVIDLALASGPDPEARAALAAEVVRGFGHFGLVYLRHHGVDAAGVAELYDQFGAFTALPPAAKAPFARADLWYQRGWTPSNTERAVVAGGQPDFKECWFVGPEVVDAELRAFYRELYPENVWPPAAPGLDPGRFRQRYLELAASLQAAGEALLRVAALGLGLPEPTFTELTRGGPHVTRLLHYLPLTAAEVEAGVLWGEEHTDFNLVTLLPGGRFQDGAGAPCPPPDDRSGLYLRTRASAAFPQGALVRGAAPAGCIVAQVGQQLEILTGGTFLATPHVVTAPRTPGHSRTSAAHFTHAHSSAVLAPLPRFRSEAALAAYTPPVLAGTYSLKTLVDIGLAPPSALDRLGYRHYGRLGALRAADLSAAQASTAR